MQYSLKLHSNKTWVKFRLIFGSFGAGGEIESPASVSMLQPGIRQKTATTTNAKKIDASGETSFSKDLLFLQETIQPLESICHDSFTSIMTSF
jgi:hypothetical protein